MRRSTQKGWFVPGDDGLIRVWLSESIRVSVIIMKRFCCVITEWLCVGCLPLVGVAAAPGERVFPSCTDYHCDEIEQVQLTAEHWQDVRDLFAPGA